VVGFLKLRLSGFKSFVDPTEIGLEAGVTGIVGPNGCGKSNLVEALRWVMGESSARRMRGSEMEDVIFAGSATRPPRNLCDVSLLLDNSDRRAPAELNHFDQLEIVRRIERDKGSTYRVNGREVRARDVQLLFADAASGAQSAAIVAQGRVSALVNGKPTDRRLLLEEAAGIAGLQSRRHEAELRLKAAETNLERLEDVLQTLGTQLEGLKRQAKQAARYRRVGEDLRRSRAVALLLEARTAEQAVAAARSALAACESALAERARAVEAAAAAQAEAAAAVPPRRMREAEVAAALQRLKLEREERQREAARAAEALGRARCQGQDVEADLRRAAALAEEAAAALIGLAAERAALQEAAPLRQAALDEARRQQTGDAARVAGAEEAVGAATRSLAAAESAAAAEQRRQAELANRLNVARQRLAAARADLAKLADQRGPADRLAAIESDLAEQDTRATAAAETLEGAELRLGTLRGQESSAREARVQAETRTQALAGEIRSLAGLLEKSPAGTWPPLLDRLQVAPGYEAALAAALGDDLEAPEAPEAPRHWLDLRAPPPGPALPDGVTSLTTLVQGAGPLARRLGQVGLAADADHAGALQPVLAVGQRLVTADGGLWRWDGFVVRPGAPNASARRLTQRNRLRELRRQSVEAEADRATAAEAHEAVRAELADAGRLEKEAREAQRLALQKVRDLQGERARLLQAVAALAARRTALEDTLGRLQDEQDEAEAAVAAGQRDAAALPDLSALRAALAERRAALAEGRARLAEAETEARRQERELQAGEVRLAAVSREEDDWRRRQSESVAHREQLAARRDAAAEDLRQLTGLPDRLAAEVAELAERIGHIEEAGRAAADRLAEAEAAAVAAEKALRAAEAHLAEGREARVRAEAGAEQAVQALEAVRRRASEQLDCSADDLARLAALPPDQDPPELAEVQRRLERLEAERERLGPVNLRAELECEEVESRIGTLVQERDDVVAAIAKLRRAIGSLNQEGRARLLQAFEQVNGHFSSLFTRLFGGGKAELRLTGSDDPLTAGLEILAQPPGKRLQTLSLLSGGEQALTALSLLFAVFLTNPAPICVLDEVDAPLDDANVNRFCDLVHELSRTLSTRFLVITHHRLTMARLDRLYGVTMAERGISRLVSVDLGSAVAVRDNLRVSA